MGEESIKYTLAEEFNTQVGFISNFESFTNYTFTKDRNKRSEFKKNSFLTIVALTLIAFFTVCIACIIDISAYFLIITKRYLATGFENPVLGYFCWIGISTIMIICATSFGYFFAPEADGSGIPEVKSILSGVEMPNYLTWKTLASKVCGLVCCSGALSIGKEGPHVHISTIIAHKILKFPIFISLKKHPGVQGRIMESSVTAGVAAVMGAPIGSIFFSMELTSTFYMVNNIIFSLYCGILSTFFLFLYRLLNLTETVHHTHIPEAFNNYDLICFGLIGIICGGLGVFFVSVTKFLV